MTSRCKGVGGWDFCDDVMRDGVGNIVTSQESAYFAQPVWFCADLAGLQCLGPFAFYWWMGKGRSVFPVGPKLCTFVYDCLLSKTVRTAKCFGSKRWQLLYIGNSCSCSLEVLNTLRTGVFKLFKCTFPVSKQFKSNFILCFFKYL